MTIITSFLCAVVVAEVVWLVPATIINRNEQLDNTRREIQLMLRAAVDHTNFPTIQTEVQIGQRLMGMSPILGGTIFNAVGSTLDGFGERPETRPSDIDFNGSFMRMVDFNTMETVFLDRNTGLPHHLLLRVDVRGVNQAVLTQVWRSAISIAAIIGFAMVILFLIVHYLVLRPLRTIRESAIYALENPQFADEYLTGISRGDEIGDLGKAMDQLLFGLSLTYREDLLVLESMIQSSALAIITYRKDGTLYSINEGAMKLIGVQGMAEMQSYDPNFLVFKSSSKPQSLLATLDNGDYRGQCRIITKRGQRPILIAATTHRDEGNRVLRYSMFAVDITRYVDIIEEQTAQINDFNMIKSGLRSQIAELKLAFESCMVSMEQDRGMNIAAAQKSTVLPDRLVASWLDAFNIGGEETVFHETLPPVLGRHENVRHIFRQGLTFIQLKSVFAQPSISIGARVDLDKVYFTISDDSAPNQVTRKPTDPAHSAWPMSLKCFMTALKQEGGEVKQLSKDDKPLVIFSLPLDIDAFREQGSK